MGKSQDQAYHLLALHPDPIPASAPTKWRHRKLHNPVSVHSMLRMRRRKNSMMEKDAKASIRSLLCGLPKCDSMARALETEGNFSPLTFVFLCLLNFKSNKIITYIFLFASHPSVLRHCSWLCHLRITPGRY